MLVIPVVQRRKPKFLGLAQPLVFVSAQPLFTWRFLRWLSIFALLVNLDLHMSHINKGRSSSFFALAGPGLSSPPPISNSLESNCLDMWKSAISFIDIGCDEPCSLFRYKDLGEFIWLFRYVDRIIWAVKINTHRRGVLTWMIRGIAFLSDLGERPNIEACHLPIETL